jgi:mutator protein MutT
MAPMAADPVLPAEIAAAVIEDRGRFLIARRPDHVVLGGYWEFPGGKRLAGESLLACLAREVQEEVGVEIDAAEPLDRVVYAYPHGVVDISFFQCRLKAGTPRPVRCAEVRWVGGAELAAYRFPPANESVISRLAGNLTSVRPVPHDAQ